MDMNSEALRIAQRYGCDPKDPIFGVLERVTEMTQEIRVHLQQIGSQADLARTTEQVKETVLIYQGENKKAETLSQRFAENITAHGQIRLREKLHWSFVGALIAFTFLGVTLLVGLPLKSLWVLQRGHVSIEAERLPTGTRLVIGGPAILKSGKTNSQLMVEFEK